MVQQLAEYEAVYLGKYPCYEADLTPALAWAAERASQLNCGITVVAPSKAHFQDTGVLARLPASVGRETPRTLGQIGRRTQPVVVSCWPSSKDLDLLDGLQSLKALVVVPWNDDEISTWRQARRATDLLGHREVAPEPTISDPVVAAALTDLTKRINLSTGLNHPDDRSAAIQAFRILKRNRHQFQPDEIRAWAMANGWSADHARALSEYAAGVLASKAYRTKGNQWVSHIITIWRKEAAGKS
jgi:hypothetical protein